jgi:hypothetical protein
MKFGYNLPPAEEAKMNAVGDKLAETLNIPRAGDGRDSQGRVRWDVQGGDKTGIGVLRTIERVLAEQVKAMEGQKVVRNLLSGAECVIPKDTPLCCDPSSETYHCM